MTREVIVSAFAFGFFVVCPRMAGMSHIIKSYSAAPMFLVALLGILVSVPLLFLMIFVSSKTGIWGALAVCVITDLAAALLMKEISMKAGIETFVIALFVIAG